MARRPPAGKRRLHDKANPREIDACRPWIAAEIEGLNPQIIFCLGATAAQTLLGKDFRVTKMRGQWLEYETGQRIIATVHPSAILRSPDVGREVAYLQFVGDLALIATAVPA